MLRLLSTEENDLTLRTFSNHVRFLASDHRHDYAALSHCWSQLFGEEVTYAELRRAAAEQATEEQLIAVTEEHPSAEQLTVESAGHGTRRLNTFGWSKLFDARRIARDQGYDWIWIDTCCIDKSDSTELSEAINSMYAWYSHATICYAFLDDVPPLGDLETSTGKSKLNLPAFERSRWFTRGWTLQELIAPRRMEFYDQKRGFIGTRQELSAHIQRITNIGSVCLGSVEQPMPWSPTRASVAQRMSWASNRYTSKIEDTAYCLPGIFGVNMALLYGEGENAFTRLQLEIIAQLSDDSIFAWGLDEKSQEVPFSLDKIVNEPKRQNALERLHMYITARSPEESIFAWCGRRQKREVSYEPGQRTSQANMNAVLHSSKIPPHEAFLSSLFGTRYPFRSEVRLRCLLVIESPMQLWLRIKRGTDGQYHRTAITSKSTRWFRMIPIALQQFTTTRKEVNVASRSPETPDHSNVKVDPPTYWWDKAPTAAWSWFWFIVRWLVIVRVLTSAGFDHPTCSAGSNSRDGAFMVTVVVVALRDVFMNKGQFWALIVMTGFFSGLWRIAPESGPSFAGVAAHSAPTNSTQTHDEL